MGSARNQGRRWGQYGDEGGDRGAGARLEAKSRWEGTGRKTLTDHVVFPQALHVVARHASMGVEGGEPIMASCMSDLR